MLADDRPGDAGVAVGISAVELVAVVQAHGDLERFCGRRAPFENFLAQYMRKYPCIQPVSTICFCAAFHSGS